MKLDIPPRQTSYVALAAVIVASIAAVYRQLAGNNIMALVLGLLAIFIGIFVIVLTFAKRHRQYHDALSASGRYSRISRRARKIGWLGAIFVVGSFFWLALTIKIFGAFREHELYFDIWLILFLMGFVMIFLPTVVRWAIMIGFIRSNNDTDK